MTGLVDGSGRAILRVRIKVAESEPESDLDVWIDTGFTGELVVSKAEISTL